MGSSYSYPEKVLNSPIEDLMVQHSVLRRALLIYEECIRRLTNNEELDPALIADTTDVIDKVIINLHAPLERAYIFPMYEKSEKYSKMAQILDDQHNAAGGIEKEILKYSNREFLANPDNKNELINFFRKAIRVFRPHIDREDTEMFPDFKDFISVEEYYALGDKFIGLEEKKFGERGLRAMVDKIEAVEKALGINDLDSFTPR
jgi:hemerythrin-like domain-containing protein